jgi:single-stranded DNA-binding protein
VNGRLRSRSWEDGEGKRRSAVEVVANKIEFLDSRVREESPFEAVTS